LTGCLEALYRDLNDGPASEVIVVDGGSTDESVRWLRSKWPAVTVIELGTNRGFSFACNAGAAAARSPIVVFLNNDAVVQRGWSAALRVALCSSPDVVIAGGLALFSERPSYVNSAGIRMALSGAATDRAFGQPLGEVDLTEGDVAGVSGVSMAVSHEWFSLAGGFDERFFMYFEDADLCLRAWVEGHRVRFTPESVVMHAFGGTAGDRSAEIRHYYGSRNRILAAAKSFGMVRLAFAVPLSLLQDLVVVVLLLARGKFSVAAAAARGKLRGGAAGLREIPHYLRGPRRAVTRKRSVADLRALGVIDSLRVSLREFFRMRGL
jgi:GT2 family glycosyltransferase